MPLNLLANLICHATQVAIIHHLSLPLATVGMAGPFLNTELYQSPLRIPLLTLLIIILELESPTSLPLSVSICLRMMVRVKHGIQMTIPLIFQSFSASMGFYSPAGSDQFIAALRPERNWVALEDDPPFQSWE